MSNLYEFRVSSLIDFEREKLLTIFAGSFEETLTSLKGSCCLALTNVRKLAYAVPVRLARTALETSRPPVLCCGRQVKVTASPAIILVVTRSSSSLASALSLRLFISSLLVLNISRREKRGTAGKVRVGRLVEGG